MDVPVTGANKVARKSRRPIAVEQWLRTLRQLNTSQLETGKHTQIENGETLRCPYCQQSRGCVPFPDQSSLSPQRE